MTQHLPSRFKALQRSPTHSNATVITSVVYGNPKTRLASTFTVM